MTLPYPILSILLAVAAGVAYAAAMYMRDRRTAEFPHWTVRGLAAMRAIAVAAIVLLLMGPLLRTVMRHTERPIVIIAQDNSASVPLNADSSFYKKEYPDRLDALRQALAGKYEVRSYAFGHRVRETDSVTFEDSRTDIAQLFRELDNLYVNRNAAAVVLASDGIINRGADPVYSPLRLRAPIYAIALGDTSVKKDIVLAKVDHNRYAYLGNRFPLEISIDAEQFKGQGVLVQVSGEHGVLWEERVSITSSSFRKTIRAELNADTPGLNRLRVTVEQLRGELSYANNALDVFIEVLDGRQKVLILSAAPHPDIAAIRRSISSNRNYEVEVALAGQGDITPARYDLIVLHQLPQQGGEGKPMLDKALASDVPLMAIIGPRTDLSALNALNLGLRVTGGRSQNQSQPLLARGFSQFSVDEGLRRMLNRFPPLGTPFGEYALGGGAQPMLLQRIGNVDTEHPLLAFSDLSGRKTAVLAGEGLWRWRMKDFQDNASHQVFDGMMSKIVQYLAVKTDKSLFRVSAKNRLSEDEQAVFDCELYNESYEPDNSPDANLTIRDSNGKEYSYTFGRTETAYRLNAGSFKQGSYAWTATVSHAGKVHEAKGRFEVAALRMESTRTTADHALLHRLARNSGGELFYPKEMERVAEAIASREDVRTVVYEQTTFREAIHLKWPFFLILLLLSAEWALRRRGGTY